MKITIDVSDFYLDENENLEEGLQQYVKNAVLQEIWKRIEKKVDDYLAVSIKDEVEKSMYKQMNLFIDQQIRSGEVKSSRDSSKRVTIENYIKEKFEYDSGWSSPHENIKKLAQAFGQDMKNRYDLLFASQLVSKMNEAGLLKEDVAKILLQDNKTK